MPDVSTLTLNNGVTMPALGLGVFQTPPEETRVAVAAALEAGYRHIDTAAAYGNERQVGEAVAASGVDRGEVFLETKIWISDYGYDQTLHGALCRVELRGFEPLTSSMPWKRATNCAKAPCGADPAHSTGSDRVPQGPRDTSATGVESRNRVQRGRDADVVAGDAPV